jgi:hypothetical protein
MTPEQLAGEALALVLGDDRATDAELSAVARTFTPYMLPAGPWPEPQPAGMTDDEHALVATLGRAAELLRRVIGNGPLAAHDWSEAAHHLHVLQAMGMRNLAARVYPDLYRPLGDVGAWDRD